MVNAIRMNFDESIRYLLSLGHETLAIKQGLQNTTLLLERLGNPHESYEAVQIAGTNGKGSTAAVVESICRAAGIHAGLYTSPHLTSITERILIAGQAISRVKFSEYAGAVRRAAEDLRAQGELTALPTFFEQVTAIALLAFKEAGVSLAILETGMGGRLDSTTVAAAKTVAITPVDLDHEEYLGNTLEQVASEKAAIIRPGVTAVVADQPRPALEAILKRAAECNVVPSIDECRSTIQSHTSDGRFRVTFETSSGRYENVLLGFRGRHQITNVALAVRLAEALRGRGFAIPATAIVQGIESANHPGRLEIHPGAPSLLLDGAHNPAGAQALRRYLEEFVHSPVTLIFGAMNDKKLDLIATNLFPAAERLIITRPDNPRSASLGRLQQLASNILKPENIIAVNSVAEALQVARKTTSASGLICIAGSLYLVGEVKAILNESRVSQVVA